MNGSGSSHLHAAGASSVRPTSHLLWLGVVALAAWARWLTPWWLLVPAAIVLLWTVRRPPLGRLQAAAVLLLLLGTLMGFLSQADLSGPGAGIATLRTIREERAYEALEARFGALLESGDEALQETLDILPDAGTPDFEEGLSRIRNRHRGLTALAAYDSEGQLIGWVGVHRGQVPQAIRDGESHYAFGGGPLFRYLYFTARDPDGGGTVVAAALLQTNLPAGLEGGGFASRFRRDTGLTIEVLPPDRATGPVVWDLRWERWEGEWERLASVVMVEEPPQVLRGSIVRAWVRSLALVLLLAWVALVVGGKGRRGTAVEAGLSLVLVAVLLPAGEIWPGVHLTSPAQFLFPGTTGGTLGQVLGIVLALGFVCGLFPPRRWRRGGPLVGAVLVAVLFPALVFLFSKGPSPALLSDGPGGWLPFQAVLSLSMALVGCLAVGIADAHNSGKRGAMLVGFAVALAVALAFVGGLRARSEPGLSPLFLSLWAVPTYLAIRGLERIGSTRRLVSWFVAGLLGVSAALPAAWGVQIEARMAQVEGQVADLGAGADPYLEFRLLRMAEAADSLNAVISSPVELLYEIWAETGKEAEPLPMWLTLWSAGDYPQDLAMGVYGDRPPEADDDLDLVREQGTPLIRHLGLAEARYLLLVPLPGDVVLSAVVPPKGSPARSSPLGPIFAAMGGTGMSAPAVVPAPRGEEAGLTESMVWERTSEGWRVKRPLSYAEGWFYALQTVPLPGTLHMVARGTLALLLNLLMVLAVWGTARAMARGRELKPREVRRFLGSFRARVTLALFAFFLLSIAIFGTLAFQTLSGAAQRTASALAERLVEDGASFYPDVQGSMPLLAREVGADLLEYRNGELVAGSSEELVQLGLYETWIPEPAYRSLANQTEVRATHRSSLGGWGYVMAYRRLVDGDVLATPVPVEIGASALRRQEVADLLGFAIVLGAGLSLALALLVGRTLTRPIETLQVASERVGSGNLRVRLPEARSDEFGAVFSAFNRMVLSIRRARRALLRTTRRTQAIVEEAATGVVALDAAGRVTLVNPRAEALLNEKIELGEPLPGREGKAGELVRWVDLYFRDGLREANTERQMGKRRIRVRARRISGEGPLGGAVLSLEDVTDELRSERILAWGEMAQQVAHEVKNPLTPIKLSVQHLQRAWEDKRPDFGEILGRNVEVILKEIEHLATIARSFSRFGAPGTYREDPLGPVLIHAVAEEVMNLYRGGKGALMFRCTIPIDLPAVQARESELREVLINLLENSRAAIPDEGEVVIEAERATRGVELRVRDNGTGIPSEFLPRIFEPHFSTRSTGTGLGLAIVRRLVESWGGSVSAESRPGGGTTVAIAIPQWEGGNPVDGRDQGWS